MAKTIGVEKAREQLPELLNRAARGDTTIITKHGKPYAALGPVPQQRTRRHSFMALAGTGVSLYGDSAAAFVSKERDAWE